MLSHGFTKLRNQYVNEYKHKISSTH